MRSLRRKRGVLPGDTVERWKGREMDVPNRLREGLGEILLRDIVWDNRGTGYSGNG